MADFLDFNNLPSVKWQQLFEEQQIRSIKDVRTYQGNLRKCSALAAKASDDDEKENLAKIFKISKETLELTNFLDSNNLPSSKWQPILEEQQIQSVNELLRLQGDLKKCSFLASKARDDIEKQCLAQIIKISKETLELAIFLESNNLPSSKWQPIFEEQQIQSVDELQTFQGDFKIYIVLAAKASDDDEKQCLAQIIKISKETLELAFLLDNNNLPSSKWQPIFEEQQIRNVEELQTFQGDLKICSFLAAKSSDDDEKQCLAQIFKMSKETLELAMFLESNNLPSTKWQPIFEEQQIRSVGKLQTFQGDIKKYSALATKASDDDEKQCLAQTFKIPKESLELIVFLDSNNLQSSKWQPLFKKQQIQSVNDIPSSLQGNSKKCSFLASKASDDDEKQSLAELFKIPKETLELMVFLDSNNLPSSKWQPLFEKQQIQSLDEIPSSLQGNLRKCSFLSSKASDDDEKQSLAELFKIPKETLELIVFLDNKNLRSPKWQPLFEKQQIQSVDDIPSSLRGDLEKCSFLASKASDDDEKQSLAEVFKIPKETLELIMFLDSNNLPSSKWQPLFEKHQIQSVNDIPSSLQAYLKRCSFLASKASDDDEKESLAQLFKIPKESLELIVYLDSNNLRSSKWQPLFEKQQIQSVDDIPSSFQGKLKKCSFLASKASDDDEKQCLAELFKIPKDTLELIVFLDSNNLPSSKWQPLFKKQQIQSVDDIPSSLQGKLKKCSFLASKANDDDEKQSLAELFKIPKETLELIVFLDSNNLPSSKWQPLLETQQIQSIDDIPSSLQGKLKKCSFLASKASDDDEKQSLAELFKIPKDTLELIVFLDSNNLPSSKWQPLFEKQQIQSVDDIPSSLQDDLEKCSFLASKASDDDEKQSLAKLFKIPKKTLELIVFLDSNNLPSSKWQPLFEKHQIQSVNDIPSSLQGKFKKCSFLASKASDDDEKQSLAELFKIPKDTLELIVFLDSNNLPSSKWQPLFEKQQIQSIGGLLSLQGDLRKCSFLAFKASDDDEKQCLAQIIKISKETLELANFLECNNLSSSKWQPIFEEQQIQSVNELQTFQGDFKIYSVLAAKASDDDEKQCLAQIFKISKETLELAFLLDSNDLPSTKWEPIFEEQQIRNIEELQTFQGDLKICSVLAAKASDDVEKQCLAQTFKMSKETLELAILLESNNLPSTKWQPIFEEQQIRSVGKLQTFQGDIKKCSVLAAKASDDDEKQSLAQTFKIPKETLELIVFLDSNNLPSSKWQPLFEKQQIQTVDDIPSSLQGDLKKCSFLASKASDDDEKQCLAQIVKIPKETLELMVFLDSNNLPSSKWQPLFEKQQIQTVDDIPSFLQSDFKKCCFLASKASDDNEKQCLAQIVKISKETLELILFLDSNNLPSTKWQPLLEEQQVRSVEELLTIQVDLRKCSALAAKASNDDESNVLHKH